MNNNKFLFVLLGVIAVLAFTMLLSYFRLRAQNSNFFDMPLQMSNYGLPTVSLKWGLDIIDSTEADNTFILTGIIGGVYQSRDEYWMSLKVPSGQVEVFLGYKEGSLGYLEDGVKVENGAVNLIFYRDNTTWKATELLKTKDSLQTKIDNPVSLIFRYGNNVNNQNIEFDSLKGECEENEYCTKIVGLWKKNTSKMIEALDTTKSLNGEELIVPITNLLSV